MKRDTNIVLGPIRACRLDPKHDHWVYECPLVLDAIDLYGELKTAEGILKIRKGIRCTKTGAPFRCGSCGACQSLKSAEDDVTRLQDLGKTFASSGEASKKPRTPPPAGQMPAWE